MIEKNYIESKKVKFYTEVIKCDKCGVEMTPQPMVFMTFPVQYPYKCPSCGSVTTLKEFISPGVIKFEYED